MASQKVSALTALTTAGSDDLLYIADTSDSGSSYASKRITVSNFLNGYATESYVATQVSNLIDGAPSALDTLNELAAALNDDASAASSLTSLINANETHIDNSATLSGVAKDSTNLGTFSGSTIADSETIKGALQDLETSLESKASAQSVVIQGVSIGEIDTNVDDLITLSGISENTNNLGTFTGSTISDSENIKGALQDLETAVEAAAAGSAVADTTKTVTSSTDASHYLTFVTDDNSSATAEALYTDAGVSYNPSLNLFTVAGRVHALDLTIDSVNVTATATELNVLDGITSTTAELNILDGVTATTAELNYVDGVTSNIQTQIDAKCATGANVNTLVGTTSAQTVPVDGNGDDNYLFLVVNKANGALTAVDKTFLEAEG